MNVMSETIEQEPSPASATDTAIDAVTISQQDALENIEHAGVAMLTGLTKVQREVAGFVTERISQDLDAQREMLRCRTIGDVQSMQARFLKTAVEQYSSEANRLFRIGSEMMSRSLDRGA